VDRVERPDILQRLIHYKPLESQIAFHHTRKRFKGFSGPIGSGKSQALCHEAIRLGYVNAGRTGLIGAPTYAMLRDATQAALFEILNVNELPYEFNKAENVLTLTDTRSKILCRSLDEYERLRGTNLAWFAVDELTYVAGAAWERLEGRLRDPKAKELCGFGVWTPKGYDWVWRRFIGEPVEGYGVVLAKPGENRYLLEAVPDFYERLKKSYDEQFYAQEVLGEYVAYHEGRVYRAFSRPQNLVPCRFEPRLPVHWALDFNVNPMCSVVAQVEGETVRVLDEIVLSRASTQEACAEFSRRYSNCPAGIVVHADASARRMQTTGSSDADIIRDYFARERRQRVEYRIPASNPAVRDRVGLTNAKLANADGEATLTLDPRCKGLIADFEEVSWRGNTTEIDKDKDPRRTHLSDAVGYLLWDLFHPRQRVGEQQKRLL
jgi:hypothetical protein